jgi:hypothetical protein
MKGLRRKANAVLAVFGLQSLSAAMQAEAATVLVVNKLVHERFFCGGIE